MTRPPLPQPAVALNVDRSPVTNVYRNAPQGERFREERSPRGSPSPSRPAGAFEPQRPLALRDEVRRSRKFPTRECWSETSAGLRVTESVTRRDPSLGCGDTKEGVTDCPSEGRGRRSGACGSHRMCLTGRAGAGGSPSRGAWARASLAVRLGPRVQTRRRGR